MHNQKKWSDFFFKANPYFLLFERNKCKLEFELN